MIAMGTEASLGANDVPGQLMGGGAARGPSSDMEIAQMLKSLGSNDPRAAHLDDPRMGGPGQPIGDLGQEPPMMLPQGGSGVLLAQ